MKIELFKQLLPCICLFLSSCQSKPLSSSDILNECGVIARHEIVNNDTVVVCDLSAAKATVQLPLSVLVDSFNVIKLDKKDEALVGKGFVQATSNGFIGIIQDSSPYKLFTRNGEFAANIGAIGQGPGEYINIYSSQIDESLNRIYLLPWITNKLLVYDLQGNYIESIQLSYTANKGLININATKQEITIVELSFDDTEDPAIWVQDFKGNLIYENKSQYMQVFPDFSSEMSVYERENDHITFSIHRASFDNDSLYTFFSDAEKLTPLYTTSFGNDVIPMHHYLSCKDYFVTEIVGPNPNPKTYLTAGTHRVVDRVIVDKKTLKGGHVEIKNDLLGGIHLERLMSYVMFDENGITFCVEPGTMLDMIDERLSEKISAKDRDFLTSWKEQISDDDNNYVIWGKMKE